MNKYIIDLSYFKLLSSSLYIPGSMAMHPIQIAIPVTGCHLHGTTDREVPPKRWFLQEPYVITFQKTAFFIVTAMKTSNLI
jgi:hypothetical protein